MKAVLVIEVNDDVDFDKARADIQMKEDSWGLCLGNVRKKWHDNVQLKPLPQKETITQDMEEWKKHYLQGINDTISKIEGAFMQSFSDDLGEEE